MSDILDELGTLGTGLLITVDEVRPELAELVHLVATYQLFVREGRRVALLLAGLPHAIAALVSDKSVSFLPRAQYRNLGRLADFEVREALKDTIENAGRNIATEALDALESAASGIPYMLQLLAYRAWEVRPEAPNIDAAAATEAIEQAKRQMDGQILAPTYRELSDADRAFLSAMAADVGDSAVRDVALRLGKSSAWVNQYRRRLLAQCIIGTRGRGRIGFDLPLMREYVKEREDAI